MNEKIDQRDSSADTQTTHLSERPQLVKDRSKLTTAVITFASKDNLRTETYVQEEDGEFRLRP